MGVIAEGVARVNKVTPVSLGCPLSVFNKNSTLKQTNKDPLLPSSWFGNHPTKKSFRGGEFPTIKVGYSKPNKERKKESRQTSPLISWVSATREILRKSEPCVCCLCIFFTRWRVRHKRSRTVCWVLCD